MATYQRVMDMLGGTTDEQKQSDILAPAPGGATQQTAPVAPGETPQAGSEQVVAAIPGAGTTNTSTTGESDGQKVEQKSAGKQMLEANQGQVTADISAPVKADIGTAEQKLQNEANQYSTDIGNYAEQNAIANPTIKNAIDTGTGTEAIQQRLNTPGQLQAYNYSYDPNAELAKLQNLTTTGGAASSLADINRKQFQNYNQRQAELDAALLRQNQGFLGQVRGAQESAANLGVRSQTEAQRLEALRQAELGQYAGGTKDIQDYLNQYGNQITSDISGRVAGKQSEVDKAYAAALAKAQTQAKAAAEKYATQVQGTYKGNTDYGTNVQAQLDAAAKAVRDQENADAYNKYIQGQQVKVGNENVTTQADIDKYNRIMNLLGQGKSLSMSALGTPSAQLDQARYEEMLRSQALGGLTNAQQELAKNQYAREEAARQAEAAKAEQVRQHNLQVQSATQDYEKALKDYEGQYANWKAQADAYDAEMQAQASRPVMPGQLAISTTPLPGPPPKMPAAPDILNAEWGGKNPYAAKYAGYATGAPTYNPIPFNPGSQPVIESGPVQTYQPGQIALDFGY